MLLRVVKKLSSLFLKGYNLFMNRVGFFSSINEHIKKGDTLFILGNGPSLNEHLENSCSIIASNPCVCVNHFVSTDFYSLIRPCIYVLADPIIFLSVLPKNHRDKAEAMWRNLLDRTRWNMDLIVPSQYRNNKRIQEIAKNKFINVLFCNMFDCSFYSNKQSQFKLFNRNLLSVPAQTVLNMAIYLAIFWQYKNIILLGADTSWHEDMRVDQKTNQVYFEDKHFYETKIRLVYLNSEETVPIKFHEELLNISNAFKSYWLLHEYAEYNSVSVFNASGKSWIDAFERKTLEEMFEVKQGPYVGENDKTSFEEIDSKNTKE